MYTCKIEPYTLQESLKIDYQDYTYTYIGAPFATRTQYTQSSPPQQSQDTDPELFAAEIRTLQIRAMNFPCPKNVHNDMHACIGPVFISGIT